VNDRGNDRAPGSRPSFWALTWAPQPNFVLDSPQSDTYNRWIAAHERNLAPAVPAPYN